MGVKDLQDLKKISILRSQIDGKKIEDIMITEFSTISPDDQIGQALSVMRETGAHDLPVTENGNYLGMIGYGTILKKKSISFDAKVKNHMHNLHTVSLDTSITELAEIMVVNNYRQLPVLNKHKKVAGVLSRSGLMDVAADIKAFSEIKVWEIMTSPVESVDSSSMLSEALEIMRGLDIRTVPVTDKAHHVVGIVGMKEVIEHNWKKKDSKTVGDLSGKNEQTQITVDTVCATAPRTLNWDDNLSTAIQMMQKYGISTLPVTEENELIGVLTQYDILELISACRERDVVFVEISGLDEKDKLQSDLIYEVIAEELSKVSKIYKPQSMIMHVAKYSETGDRHKYSISARLVLDRRVISLKEVGWDIITVSKDLMKKVSADAIEMKDTAIGLRKKGKA